jgi:hypothetical protein
MKKEYAVKTLNRIKEIQNNYHHLKKLGVDLIDYENGVNLLEESIAIMYSTNETEFENVLKDVQWWLYERVNKVITLADKTKVNVSKVEDFVNWLEKWYNGTDILYDLINQQEEIINSPLRFNGVSVEKIKQIFAIHGIDYNAPF